MARLHGLSPATPSGARVLELGCGAGVNLLAIASALPGARCVGVDIDRDAIERGRALARAAGLDDVELIRADLRAADGRVGEADYILVHGVWSWVGDEVRTAIAGLCASKLSADGVVLISYNALPGWYTWLPAQALARIARANGSHAGADPVAAARHAVTLARDLHGPGDGLYARVLAASAERYERLEPGLLAHDDLAEHCTPCWLEEVVETTASAGLRYLGEAMPEQWWQWRVARGAADRVRGASASSAAARQQLADLAAGVDFKASLFVRAQASPASEPDPSQVLDLHALARPHAEPPPPGAPPAVAEIARALGAADSQAIPVAQLARACALSEETAARGVLQLTAERRADLRFAPPPLASAVAERPEASALARAQASTGAEVSSLCHEQVAIEQPAARALLQLIDGTRDRAMLADELARIEQTDRGRAAAALERYLQRLASLGLLRDGPLGARPDRSR